MAEQISAHDLQNLIEDKQELALLDVRKHEDFIKGPLWLAINIPHDSIESRINRYVPRRDSKVVLIDEGNGLANRVAKSLQSIAIRIFVFYAMALTTGGKAACRRSRVTMFWHIRLACM